MNSLETYQLSINDSSRPLERAQTISAPTSAIIFSLAVFGYPIIANLVDWLGVDSIARWRRVNQAKPGACILMEFAVPCASVGRGWLGVGFYLVVV